MGGSVRTRALPPSPSLAAIFIAGTEGDGDRGDADTRHCATERALLCRTAVSDEPSASCGRAASLSGPGFSFSFPHASHSAFVCLTALSVSLQASAVQEEKDQIFCASAGVRGRRRLARAARWRSSSVHRSPPSWRHACRALPRLVMRSVRGWVGWRRPSFCCYGMGFPHPACGWAAFRGGYARLVSFTAAWRARILVYFVSFVSIGWLLMFASTCPWS
jgi:hypothetical protein